ncbi:hypothetical protein PAAG_02958 [Paracoccidioides lutzii Pb01]|uniref:Uncharacterized protein n=1 Tax=Paracoccidioides lutzii (strain ATCC MYA-826 / Pb01) TaxID=502779 RepID=C1GWR3_PARBA|nr:hypothetical protein PAAG_02958 [Paracoccidioides lutzii Pb01]EEH40982.2 hypothetical protein PAAG_02958 [Paracoccidioides lutzii Pb01]
MARKTKNSFQKNSRKRKQVLNGDPVTAFFNQYPQFNYHSDQSIASEFYRMCDYFEWGKQNQDRKNALREFKNAMVMKFNDLYGSDTDDINCWHRLCIAVDIDPLPQTIKACKKEIEGVHVNLVDLVDNTTGQQARLFASLDELRAYTIKNGKYFPRESAYAGGVLKYLLREIYNTR